jgi:hypothetical protein
MPLYNWRPPKKGSLYNLERLAGLIEILDSACGG